MNKIPFSIFSVFGIELEYMIVDRISQNILPITDKVIERISGKIQNEFSFGEIAISNELALHVIELKTDGPTNDLKNSAIKFHQYIQYINEHLEKFNAKLMPAGAHPWLDPHNGIALWPHGDCIIYQTYNNIFNCSGHGWGNLQSTHLNLPFANDNEFKLLHDAIRLLLPIIPALTASTPILEGKYSNYLDGRLYYYGKNQQKLPLIAGDLIPEPVVDKQEYFDKILSPMYESIAPYDPQKILQEEWLNSRAAIARFERNAIEIRILDTQEAPQVDLAFIEMIVAALKTIVDINSKCISSALSSVELKSIYDRVIEKGTQTIICHHPYLQSLGLVENTMNAKQIWNSLYNKVVDSLSEEAKFIMQDYFHYGNLAERIKIALGDDLSQHKLSDVYHQLSQCLAENRIFLP